MAVQSKVDQESIGLMAHLMRRAGFGADRDELERRAAVGYEATVDGLLNPEGQRADRQQPEGVQRWRHARGDPSQR